MSIQSVIDFIKNKFYLINDELSIYNKFRGDINEYNMIGNNYINIIKDKFQNYYYETQKSIIINDNNLWFYIQINNLNDINNNSEITWIISIADNINKLI